MRYSSTAAYWPDTPILARSAAASRTTSRPSTVAVPDVGSSSVVSTRTAVVLPAPLGPSRPRTVPAGASRSTPSSARTSPNDFTSPDTLIAASPLAAPARPPVVAVSTVMGAPYVGTWPQCYEPSRTGIVRNSCDAAQEMTETSGRLLKLLSLLQTRRDWPGEELASRLEVSGRTIRRDIERLRSLGYPVEASTGPLGGYRLHAGAVPLGILGVVGELGMKNAQASHDPNLRPSLQCVGWPMQRSQ